MWYAKGSCVLPASGGALRPSMPSPISLAPWIAYRPTSLPARRSTCKTWVMARDVLVDAGFVVALLSSRDNHHEWAVTQASEFPPPWSTCEAVLSESFHLLGGRGAPNLGALLRRRALLVAFELADSVEPVVRLIEKYSDVPMSLADACLVRMTETLADPVILTTDQGFRVGRQNDGISKRFGHANQACVGNAC